MMQIDLHKRRMLKKGVAGALAGYYRLNNNLNDEVASNHLIIESGKSPIFSNTNKLVSFSSYLQNYYLNIPYSSATSFVDEIEGDLPFTISLGIYFRSLSGFLVVMEQSDANNPRKLLVDVLNGKLRFTLFDVSGNSIQAVSVEDMTPGWAIVSLAYGGGGLASDIEIYMDEDLLVTTKTNSGAFAGLEDIEIPISIGGRAFGGTRYYSQINIDCLGIFSEKLSLAQHQHNRNIILSNKELL